MGRTYDSWKATEPDHSPDDAPAFEECGLCFEGRIVGPPSKWGDGSPTDYGMCPTCKGTGEIEAERTTRTLEDLEQEAEDEHGEA